MKRAMPALQCSLEVTRAQPLEILEVGETQASLMRHRNPALRLESLDLAVREGHERYENDLVSINAIIEKILWLG